MEITQKQIDAAYAVASPEQKKVLDALFGKEEVKDNRPVTERIKTFDDAVKELGPEHKYVKAYIAVRENMGAEDFMDDDILAYLKLRIIVAALNEGWEPKFVNGEYRWVPWFSLLTNEEIDKMDDEDKEKACRVVGRAYSSASSVGGLAYAYASIASSRSNTSYGARLAFKTSELAEYAGKQFIEIYRDMMIDIDE